VDLRVVAAVALPQQIGVQYVRSTIRACPYLFRVGWEVRRRQHREYYSGDVQRILTGIMRNQSVRELGYVYRIFFLTHGSVGVLILAVAGFACVFSRNENHAMGAVYLVSSFALLAVLAKLFYIPFILHGRLPSGRFLADVRADRESRRRVREAREAYMTRYRY
jgi:hypothetical protein